MSSQPFQQHNAHNEVYMEEENDSNINFLDFTISKGENNISFNIHRTPTTTNTINPSDSCHPLEHKLAAMSYLTTT